MDWTKSSAELAAELGLTEGAMRTRRCRQGIPSPSELAARAVVDWSLSDAEIARRTGRCKGWASKWRKKLGKPKSKHGPQKKGIDWDAQPLGEVPDLELARRLGVNGRTVTKARQSRGIEFTDACRAEQARRQSPEQRLAAARKGTAANARRAILRHWQTMRPRVWASICETLEARAKSVREGPVCDRPRRSGLKKGLMQHGLNYCTRCKSIRPLADWAPSQKHSWCRACYNRRKSERYANDECFRMSRQVRRRLREVMATDKRQRKRAPLTGVNWRAIVDYLGPSPGDGYEVDHVIPLRAFDLSDRDQLLLACSPENHVWMRAEDNYAKADRLHTGERARDTRRQRWTINDIVEARDAWARRPVETREWRS